jgi:hypothetical protein
MNTEENPEVANAQKEAVEEVLEGEVIDDNVPPEEPELTPEQIAIQSQMMDDIQSGNPTKIPEGMDAEQFVNSMNSGATDPRMAALAAKMQAKTARNNMELKKRTEKGRARAKVAKASRKANR